LMPMGILSIASPSFIERGEWGVGSRELGERGENS